MSAMRPDPEEILEELPLFPLNLVLFPGMSLPLHIFEERYKAMIGACLEEEMPFGVVLIKEGQEVGEPAEPFQVGTTARIVQVERMDDGRMNLLTRGERRFEIVETTQRLPHLVGRVRFMADETGNVPAGVLAEAIAEYAAFQRQVTALAGGWSQDVEVPQHPVRLSFAIAAGLASTIELPRDLRQQLLEAPSAGERLERVLPLLKRGNELVREQVEKSNPFRGPRLN